MLLKRRLGKGNNLLGQILQYRPSVQGDIELLSGWHPWSGVELCR
jgi:hypothetical protein